jgi:hypothetical protein
VKTIEVLELHFNSWQLISALNSQLMPPRDIGGLTIIPTTKPATAKSLWLESSTKRQKNSLGNAIRA